MAAFLELGAKDVQVLQGDGGAPFRDFMKQLIRAESHLLRIPAGDVISDSENMADGGCDTQVASGNSKDVNGYLTVPTCWQFKGTEKANVAEAVLREEVKKPFAATLIKEGYGYRMCIADDLTANEVSDKQKILHEEVKKINPAAPPPLVLGSTSLARWANRFPALVVSRRSVGGVQTLKTWGTSVTAETKIYVRNDGWGPVEETVKRQIDFSFDAPTACIRVRGPAGVGKTRCVYETIRTTANAAALCLYTMDEPAVTNLAYTLSNTPEAQALIVADECLNKTRQQLDQILAGVRDRVRVVVINNTDEPSYEESPEPLVERLPDEVLDQILKENFPTVSAEARRAYLSLAQGFVRIAADLCKHGDTKGLSELGSYVDSRIGGGEKQRAVQVISLFERVGWKDDLAHQLKVVAELTGWDEKRLRETCLEVRKGSPGFIVEGGRYFYVTPEAVARICFGRAWENWVAADIKGFYQALPPELAELFQLRIQKSASDKVRENFASALEVISHTFQPTDLADKKKAEEFLRLVETNPARFLPRLRQIVDRAPDNVLASNISTSSGWGVRRKLVWTCEHLAPFPDFFYDAEAILLRLAIHETEPAIGNNATAIWQQLFRLYLPGTAVPFGERIALLEKRLKHSNEDIAALAVGALNGLFALHVSRMGGPPVVAGRIPPADWRPETYEQERACLLQALHLLREALRDERERIQTAAAKLFLDEIRVFLARGFFEFVSEASKDMNFRTLYLPKILDETDNFLRFDAPNWPQRYVEQVRRWQASLLSEGDFMTRLRALIGRARRWSDEDDDKAAFERDLSGLARAFFENPQIFQESLDWLFSNDATYAFELGVELGQLDSDLEYFKPLREKSVSGDAPLTRGYIYGIVKRSGQLPDEIRRWLDQLESERPDLLYAIASSLPRETKGFQRIMRLFVAGKISPRYLSGLQYRLGHEFTRERLIELLSALSSYHGDHEDEALATAVEIAGSWINDRRPDSPRSLVGDDMLWHSIRSVIDRAMPKGTMDIYHWSNLLHAASAIDPALVIRKAVQALAEAGYISERATALLVRLAERHPDLVMQELGAVVLNDESGWKLRIGGFAGVLSAIPSNTIIKWLHCHGLDAARKIASNLPRPFLADSGEPRIPEVTERILAEFGDDEIVKKEFAVPSGFRSYSGDIVGLHLKEAEFAEKFLHHPLEPIRFWARVEKEGALHEADRWKQRIAEQRW